MKSFYIIVFYEQYMLLKFEMKTVSLRVLLFLFNSNVLSCWHIN